MLVYVIFILCYMRTCHVVCHCGVDICISLFKVSCLSMSTFSLNLANENRQNAVMRAKKSSIVS